MARAAQLGLNLGPKSAAHLREIGIETRDQLAEIGAKAAFARLKFQFGAAISLNFLYALEACLRGYHWQQLPPDVRADLIAFAEELKHKKL